MHASITAAVATDFDTKKAIRAAPHETQIAPTVTHNVPAIASAQVSLPPPAIALISLKLNSFIGQQDFFCLLSSGFSVSACNTQLFL
jgi:hypothetical protein